MRKKKILFQTLLLLAIILFSLQGLYRFYRFDYNRNLKLQNQKITNFYFERALLKFNTDANALLDVSVQKIVSSLKRYERDEVKTELLLFLNLETEHSPVLFEVQKNVFDGVVLNDLKNPKAHDANDMILLIYNPITQKLLIALDLSIDCLTEEAIRDKVIESNQQFAKELFFSTYHDLEHGRPLTFWSYLEPITSAPWYDTIKYFPTTDFELLKHNFLVYNADPEFLRTIEFLAVRQIYRFEDFFGTRSVMPNNTRTNKDLTITVVSGFNLLDQIAEDPLLRLESESLIKEKYILQENFNKHKQIFSIVILTIALCFVILFIEVYDSQENSR